MVPCQNKFPHIHLNRTKRGAQKPDAKSMSAVQLSVTGSGTVDQRMIAGIRLLPTAPHSESQTHYVY